MMMILLSLLLGAAAPGEPVTLDNGTLSVTLGLGPTGGAQVSQLRVGDGPPVFTSESSFAPSPDDHAKPFIASGWQRADTPQFLSAENALTFDSGLVITQCVRLAREGSMLRLQCRARNDGGAPVTVKRFPVWNDTWGLSTTPTLQQWDALSYAPHVRELDEPLELGSRLHCSDTRHGEGVYPYWVVTSGQACLFFSLEWSGGWQARLSAEDRFVSFSVWLPEDETQLTLAPGEEIAGPALSVVPVRTDNTMRARSEWMRQREAFARAVYGGPAPSYPWTWNHWYAARFDVDEIFFRQQAALIAPYDFDFFIVDAGWYEHVGDWTPARAKFAPGAFEAVLKDVSASGVPTGIWTCPQFIHADATNLPPEVDQPGEYEKFIDGHLLDLAGYDYPEFLVEHVRDLIDRYGISWWKYDQLLFAPETRHGVMQNVVAFEDALRAVRAGQPELYIENCQSGGRMVNDVTVLATQSQWLKDGGGTGVDHARENIRVALGAVQFLPPWCANRWMNRPYDNDVNDDEFTRMYCRSCMAGTWGLVADLAKIPARQRDVILQEVQHYRRLNALKADYLYEMAYPEDGNAAGIAFFSADRSRAGVLAIRMTDDGEARNRIPATGLDATKTYTCEDVDTGTTTTVAGSDLARDGFVLSLPPGRMSALMFYKAE